MTLLKSPSLSELHSELILRLGLLMVFSLFPSRSAILFKFSLRLPVTIGPSLAVGPATRSQNSISSSEGRVCLKRKRGFSASKYRFTSSNVEFSSSFSRTTIVLSQDGFPLAIDATLS